MLQKFRRNRKGTAEVIGSVLFIVILLYFFANVYLWHDQATKQMNNSFSDKMNSPISIEASAGQFNVTNNGGVETTLARLWIITDDQHTPLDLNNGASQQITITGGSTIYFNIASGPTTIHVDLVTKTVFVPEQPVTLKVVTTLGNTAACEYTPPNQSG